MKNISETAVGLAYSALALRDVGLAAEVRHLAERLDEMKDHLQLWVLRAAKSDTDLSPLRGLLQLASAAEELGDQANHMVWLIADDYELHPIVNVALGEADVVAMRVPVSVGSAADGRRLVDLQLDIEPGFHVLAIRRDNRYLYRPRGNVRIQAGDDLIASGPAEGQELLAEVCGWWMEERDDDPTGVVQLVPIDASTRS
ncbi:MAG: potassium channel family protein, partial [Microthrixaceae bacterium]